MKTTTMLFFLFMVSLMLPASAALVHLEDFDTDPGGTVADRDGFLTVAYDGVNEYMTGNFAFDPFNSPQTDAFVLTGANFIGSYAGITQIAFDMYAATVLPSDLFIRFVDGASTMAYQISPISGMFSNWSTFTVNLAYSAAWGVNQTTFDSILASVDQVEIQLTRSGGSSQEFRLDNVQTLDTSPGGGGGPSAVPEPSTITFFALIVVALVASRRRFRVMSA